MRIVSVGEMREIEKGVFEKPVISETLIIENVGLRCSEHIAELGKSYQCQRYVIVAGKGNNGADGIAIARHLHLLGYQSIVIKLYDDSEASKENQLQLQMANDFEVPVLSNVDLESVFENDDLVVDAILGTGLKPPIEEQLASQMEIINTSAKLIVSIDIPSGVNGDSGQIGQAAIMAEQTLAIELPKIGHFMDPAIKFVGELSVVKVGFPPEAFAGGNKFLLTQDLLDELQPRNPFSHKNSFGHLLVIGGSKGMTGACALSSLAGLKVGTGLVTARTWKEASDQLSAALVPEIMSGVIEDKKDFKGYDALVVGPGLGCSKQAEELLEELLKVFEKPMVIDADGLNNLEAKHFDLIKKRKNITVLTPHIGEFARMLGIEKSELLSDLQAKLLNFSKENNCAVVLKSAVSYLALPTGDLYINFIPNDGMATAGSGDVLAGIIGGLLAQTKDSKAIGAGILIHSFAGLEAARENGTSYMSASNIIEGIKAVLHQSH